MKVKDLIKGQVVVTAPVDQLLAEVALRMREHSLTGMPVVDDAGRLVGLVTAAAIRALKRSDAEAAGDGDSDLPQDETWSPAQYVVPTPRNWSILRAREIMVTDMCTAGADDDVRAVARALVESNVHRAVVLDSDRHVRGVVSALDFVRMVAEGSGV